MEEGRVTEIREGESRKDGEYKSRANTKGKRISVVGGVLGARRSLMYETFVSRVKRRQLNRRKRKTERSNRHFAFRAR